MPRGSSKKDERQYQHIEQSASKRGESPKRAKEIAARTVNKRRSQEGRTKTQRSSNGESPKSSTRGELYNRAKELGIPGRSKMSKRQLENALKKHK